MNNVIVTIIPYTLLFRR